MLEGRREEERGTKGGGEVNEWGRAGGKGMQGQRKMMFKRKRREKVRQKRKYLKVGRGN